MLSIASYRGPGMAGGVSTALATLWKTVGDRAQNWYYICSKSESIKCASKRGENGSRASLELILNPQLIKAHYHYCNDFIWPVMHDLPQHASYRRQDRERYVHFNRQFARVIESKRRGYENTCFIQDYQLALVSRHFSGSKQIFWHIPWPREVFPEHVEPVREIAEGLLACETIGFHTAEYADNFARFVKDHLSDQSVVTFRRERENRLRAVTAAGEPAAARRSAGRLRVLVRNGLTQRVSRVFVAPLGLDIDYWQQLSMASSSFDRQLYDMGLGDGYILSVDRADYTKGVFERIKAIDVFFCKYPHWAGLTKFVQICGRTRAGLSAFDQYWSKCRGLADSVNRRHGTDNWDPIVWIDTPMSPELLSGCYRNARVMMVNPVRDGLNLTAKEFFVCQKDDPGALLLSPGAGAWHEVGDHAVFADPHNSHQMAEAIEESLRMPVQEREQRAGAVMRTLSENTLEDWCQFFAGHTTSQYSEERYAQYMNRADSRGVGSVVLAAGAKGR
ncbi:MAG: trehalose-6-phosphate synthase [Candidatus Obscuribacterales bacterium]